MPPLTIAELKAAIRYEITKARARQMTAEERGDAEAVKKNRDYVRRCQVALQIIEQIEKANES